MTRSHFFEARKGSEEYAVYNTSFFEGKRIVWTQYGETLRGIVIGSRLIQADYRIGDLWSFEVQEVEGK